MEHLHEIGSTAFHIAYIRDAERKRPDPIFSDPYAQYFHDGAVDRAMASLEKMGVFVATIRVRTRWGDDVLTKALDSGTTQVVCLGAGFDTRELRMARAGVTFFDVDQEEDLSVKAARLAAAGIPSQAVAIGTDYTAPGLIEKLVGAGLDPQRPTLVQWEGNSYYLPVPLIKQVLQTLASGLRAPRIAFDYFNKAIIEGRSAAPGMVMGAGIVRRIGAPWQGYIDDLPALAAEAGLVVEENKRLLELHAAYLPHRDLGPDALAEVGFCVLGRI